MAKMKAGPVVTDNGNFVIDAPFPEDQMREPAKVRCCGFHSSRDLSSDRPILHPQLLTELKLITGVVEVGLFCNMAKAAYFGNQASNVPITPIMAVS